MAKFNVDVYNSLQSIAAAEARFHEQLAAARLHLPTFLDELAPLFLAEGHQGQYAACLIHRHHFLQEGERMVSYGESSKPSKDHSTNVFPERWLSTGEEVEHRYVDTNHPIPPPPSHQFLAKFRAILDKYKIDTIGICYAPTADELQQGLMFLESAGVGDRELVLDIVPDSFVPEDAKCYSSAWVPDFGRSAQESLVPAQPKSIMRCTHACIGCPP